MKLNFMVTIILSLLIGANGALSQNEKISVTVLGTVTQPVNNFAKDIGKNPNITRRFGVDFGTGAGLATTGWGGGLEIKSNVLINNFFWVISGRLLSNSSDVSTITTYFKKELGDTASLSFQFGNWLNIPVFTGFSYAVPIGEEFNLYTTIQGGFNLTRQASRTVEIDGIVVEETSFNMIPDFGYEIGCGIEVYNSLDISIRYLNLGAPRYDGTRKLNEAFFSQIARRVTYIQGDERDVSMINLLIGYVIW